MRFLVPLVVLAACEDVPQPFELEHTRIMAVRIDPPAAGAGERARIDMLVTDALDGPRLARPTSVTSPAPIAIGEDADGWFVDAPPELPDDELVIPLELTVEVGGLVLPASKTLALGTRADNPIAPVIVQDGVAIEELATMPPADEIELAIEAPGAELSYRWFSSVGDLTGYTRDRATLEPEPGSRGMLGVVVRDQAGGTAWTLVEAEVLP